MRLQVGTNIYDNRLNLVRKLAELSELKVDVDNILQLCVETIGDSHSVLIFCPTKKWCEKLAEQIATAFFRLGPLRDVTTRLYVTRERSRACKRKQARFEKKKCFYLLHLPSISDRFRKYNARGDVEERDRSCIDP